MAELGCLPFNKIAAIYLAFGRNKLYMKLNDITSNKVKILISVFEHSS
jgi:hypothetical protein